MLDKYITIENEKIEVRQNADGTWVCSKLKVNNIRELDLMIGEVNSILNKYNKKERKVTPKKEKTKVNSNVRM
jgi:hypothetical protein